MLILEKEEGIQSVIKLLCYEARERSINLVQSNKKEWNIKIKSQITIKQSIEKISESKNYF